MAANLFVDLIPKALIEKNLQSSPQKSLNFELKNVDLNQMQVGTCPQIFQIHYYLQNHSLRKARSTKI